MLTPSQHKVSVRSSEASKRSWNIITLLPPNSDVDIVARLANGMLNMAGSRGLRWLASLEGCFLASDLLLDNNSTIYNLVQTGNSRCC